MERKREGEVRERERRGGGRGVGKLVTGQHVPLLPFVYSLTFGNLVNVSY